MRQQNSIYTTTDKLFESIEKSFGSSLNNFADVKELIPEFYSRNPEFLVNWHRMEVTKEKAVKNVELPEWCKTPDEFCAIMRCALDSDIASESLNLWLDLVFGYKQNSMEFHNSFSPDCYSFDWNSCKNEISKRAMVVVLKEYGIAPEKVFNQMHSLKSFRIRVVSGYDTEVKMKMQKLQNQIQNLMQIHNKEYKAQEKQYKQLLTQETQEKNQEVLELKGKLSELRGHYALIAQQFEETVKQRNESNIQNAEKRIKSKRDGKHY